MEELLSFGTNPGGKTPKYIQIVQAITGAIKIGKLKKGDHISSINDLSNTHQLSRDTVQKAYTLLRKKGVITATCNETPLKEILLDGITVISTDHYQMGVTAAQLILENRKEKLKNPFVLIKRKSL